MSVFKLVPFLLQLLTQLLILVLQPFHLLDLAFELRDFVVELILFAVKLVDIVGLFTEFLFLGLDPICGLLLLGQLGLVLDVQIVVFCLPLVELAPEILDFFLVFFRVSDEVALLLFMSLAEVLEIGGSDR